MADRGATTRRLAWARAAGEALGRSTRDLAEHLGGGDDAARHASAAPLLHLALDLVACRTARDLHWTLDGHGVANDAARAAFVEGALERLLLELGPTVLEAATMRLVHRVLARPACHAGALQRFAAWLYAPKVVEALERTAAAADVAEVARVSRTLLRDDLAASVVVRHDRAFAAFAAAMGSDRVTEHAALLARDALAREDHGRLVGEPEAAPRAAAAEGPGVLETVWPVVTRAARLLAVRPPALWLPAERAHLDAALQLLRHLVARRGHEASPTAARLILPLCERTTWWGPDLADLMAHLMRGASVEMVVTLARRGKLDRMCEWVRDHGDALWKHDAWRDWREALRSHWPAKAAIADAAADGGGCDDDDDDSSPRPRCPITLHPCRHPATASDGRVYERDALLEHMARNGPVSPVTRQVLRYEIYAHRAS